MQRGKSSACCLANKAIWIYSIALFTSAGSRSAASYKDRSWPMMLKESAAAVSRVVSMLDAVPDLVECHNQ
jgi:hypothetical protein